MEEQKDFLGRGWAMPVVLDPRTGVVASVEHQEDIRQSIAIILETAPGERVMRPDFGCGIHNMVFATLDTTTLQRMRSEIESALLRYEPRIEVSEVRIEEDVAYDGRLLIELEYRVRRTNQIGNLVYPFYFKEGGAA